MQCKDHDWTAHTSTLGGQVRNRQWGRNSPPRAIAFARLDLSYDATRHLVVIESPASTTAQLSHDFVAVAEERNVEIDVISRLSRNVNVRDRLVDEVGAVCMCKQKLESR